MALFTSTHLNRLDKKGRVSVPALWRLGLAKNSFNGIVVLPSYRARAIEGCGYDRLERLNELLQTPGAMSDTARGHAEAMMAKVETLQFDTEGRVVLPRSLSEYAGIAGEALFVGLGPIFEIWEPGGHGRHYSSAEERARTDQPSLRDIGLMGPKT
ncbi:MAG: division/cell wall cluster transcriptional repressor MraZ [Alphaproteobacteria bacterium]|nr:division/cell wall cluster transcriptional repressor MraZ [Alphaproteobacteria bacterium]